MEYHWLCCLLICTVSYGACEILDVYSTGIWRDLPGPVTRQYVKDNIRGTTVTVCMDNKLNDTKIAIRSKNSTVLFQYEPIANTQFCATILTKENELTLFLNGVYYNYFEKDITKATDVHINTKHVKLVAFAHNEPVWATQRSDCFVYRREIVGEEVPTRYIIAQDITIEHYLLVEGLFRSNTSAIQIKLTTPDSTPLNFAIRFKDEVRYTMTSTTSDNHKHIETFSGRTIEMDTNTYKFAVALVCEQRGWRIYLNGYDFLFFYHRDNYNTIDNITLFGDNENTGGWKLLKFSHCYKSKLAE